LLANYARRISAPKEEELEMKIDSLRKLYVEELRDLYSAENQLIKALPKIAKATTSSELGNAFLGHLEQTKEHAKRLESIFQELDESPKGKKCKGMEGLLEEGSELIEEEPEPEELDAGLISAAQRVEHYEMAGYGTVVTYARLLGENRNASLLERTLEEEKETDRKLTQISEKINYAAMETGTEEGEENEKKGRRVKAKAARA
jgi:ferritin-like metal-binding protein YciE